MNETYLQSISALSSEVLSCGNEAAMENLASVRQRFVYDYTKKKLRGFCCKFLLYTLEGKLFSYVDYRCECIRWIYFR